MGNTKIKGPFWSIKSLLSYTFLSISKIHSNTEIKGLKSNLFIKRCYISLHMHMSLYIHTTVHYVYKTVGKNRTLKISEMATNAVF